MSVRAPPLRWFEGVDSWSEAPRYVPVVATFDAEAQDHTRGTALVERDESGITGYVYAADEDVRQLSDCR